MLIHISGQLPGIRALIKTSRLRKIYLIGLFFAILLLIVQFGLTISLPSEQDRANVNMGGMLAISLVSAPIIGYTANQTRRYQPSYFHPG
jgi:hypothetical protein